MENQVDTAEQVRLLVVEALAQDSSKVRMDSSLVNDLGAESLDYLDIVFRMERAFDIQITRGEMERAARGDLSDEEFEIGRAHV